MYFSGAVAPGRCWLLEGERDRCAEQFEGAPLDGRRAGELLDPLPAEGDRLAVKGGQVAEEAAVFADGELAAVSFRGIFVPGPRRALGGGDRAGGDRDTGVGE